MRSAVETIAIEDARRQWRRDLISGVLSVLNSQASMFEELVDALQGNRLAEATGYLEKLQELQGWTNMGGAVASGDPALRGAIAEWIGAQKRSTESLQALLNAAGRGTAVFELQPYQERVYQEQARMARAQQAVIEASEAFIVGK